MAFVNILVIEANIKANEMLLFPNLSDYTIQKKCLYFSYIFKNRFFLIFHFSGVFGSRLIGSSCP